jgi:hypothetical protein
MTCPWKVWLVYTNYSNFAPTWGDKEHASDNTRWPAKKTRTNRMKWITSRTWII